MKNQEDAPEIGHALELVPNRMKSPSRVFYDNHFYVTASLNTETPFAYSALVKLS